MFTDRDIFGATDQVIRDAVHGAIALHEHEVAAINHPLFQRLRFLCQNDILSFVFPGATHSRFIHSVGAMDVGSRILRRIVRTQFPDAQAGSGQGSRIMAAVEYLDRCLRLALLLHDTGHGSFSHQMERAPAIRELLSAPGHFSALWAGADPSPYYPEPPTQIHHEHYSVRAAHRILESLDLGRARVQPCDVLSLMETASPSLSPAFTEAAQDAWPALTGAMPDDHADGPFVAAAVAGLLRSLVSGELDADKGDYIIRDSLNCSTSFGTIQFDALLNALRAGWLPEEQWLGLAILSKGVPNFEDFVHSRFQLYRYIYNHKTSVGFNLLLQSAIAECLGDDETRALLVRFLTDIDAFADLTDTFFWERFRAHARRAPESDCARLVGRRKLRHLGTYENLPPFRVNEIRRTLARRLQCPQSDILCCTNHARFSQIGAGFYDIKVLAKDPVSAEISYRSLSEASDFFSKFSDQTLTHYFAR